MTIREQAECLRYYGHEEDARQVESGQLVIPPDALNTSWTCMQVANACRALADSCRNSGRFGEPA